MVELQVQFFNFGGSNRDVAQRMVHPQIETRWYDGPEKTSSDFKKIHAKLIIVDDEVCMFGSSNMGTISLKYADELNVIVDNKQYTQEVRHKLFEPYWVTSTQAI